MNGFLRLDVAILRDFRMRQLEAKNPAHCWRFIRIAEQIKTISDDGRLVHTDGSPVDVQQLAVNEIANPRAVEDYQDCIDCCVQCGLLQIVDGVICVPRWSEFWAGPRTSTQRSQDFRSKSTLQEKTERCTQKANVARNESALHATQSPLHATEQKLQQRLREEKRREEKTRQEQIARESEKSEPSQQADRRLGAAVGQFENLGLMLGSSHLQELQQIVKSPQGVDAVLRVFNAHQDEIYQQQRLQSSARTIKRPIEFLFAKIRDQQKQLRASHDAAEQKERADTEQERASQVRQLKNNIEHARSELQREGIDPRLREMLEKQLQQNTLRLDAVLLEADKKGKPNA